MSDTKNANDSKNGGCCSGAEQKKGEAKPASGQCSTTQPKSAPAKPSCGCGH